MKLCIYLSGVENFKRDPHLAFQIYHFCWKNLLTNENQMVISFTFEYFLNYAIIIPFNIVQAHSLDPHAFRNKRETH